MHLLLTDRLVCPRCGPDFGLILRADRLADRRVLAGALGCSNCRDRFPIEEGFADLRPPPRAPLGPPVPPPPPAPDATERLAALLGVARGPGHVALSGPLAAHAGALADLIEGVEVVAIDADARAAAEREGVSRMVARAPLPFRRWTFRALATTGLPAALADAVELLPRGGRLVVEGPAPDDAGRLEEAGLELLLARPDWLVAVRKTA